jgi:hypothetical protein
MAATDNTSQQSGKRSDAALSSDQLCRDLDQARSAFSSGALDLGERLNPVTSIRQSINTHPLPWLAASALGGLILARTLVPRRRSRRHSEENEPTRAGLPFAAVLGLLAKTTFNLAKPAAARLIEKRLNELVD